MRAYGVIAIQMAKFINSLSESQFANLKACQSFTLSSIIPKFPSRREHLTPEQIREHEEIQKKVETGDLGEDDFGGKGEGRRGSGQEDGDEDDDDEGEEGEGERETVQSLPPPPPTSITWEEYINAPDGQ